MFCDDLEGVELRGEGGREAQEERNISVHMADSHRCTARTNTTF